MSAGVSRRSFLLGAACAAAAVPLAARVSYADPTAPATGGDVLVVLSLRGGFDGLSAVAPVGDPDLARLRPSIAVPGSRGLDTGDRMFALHPALAPLLPLWQAGTFGAVHAVGTPDSTRSHFAATEELERAAPGTTVRTGWLDRVTGARAAGADFTAVQLGSASPHPLLAGPAPELAMRSLEDFTLASGDQARTTRALAALHTAGDASAPARGTLAALAAVHAVATGPGPQNGAAYPDTELGRALADTARLVRHGAGLQSVCLDVGDWDMHAGLGAAGGGRMADQLGRLATALAAFAQDLGPDLSRVCLVTMSEFGRRAAENGSGGTDHGHGNALLLLGGGIRGGAVHGRWPGLADAALDHGDLAGSTDYRDVLAELLVQRCGLSADGLAAAFPGYRPQPLGLTR